MISFKRLLTTCMMGLVTLSGAVFAEDTPSSQVGGSLIRPGDYLGQIMVSLLLVLAIIFVGAWLVRRYGRFSAVADGQLRVLGMLSVGQKERIMLLQVGRQQLLVGVTSSRITTLHTLDEPIDVQDPELVAPLKPSFAQRFQDALKQRHTGENS
ncbi:MAG: flagellar biosynthetic protein FliO [Thiomicrospira sp.]|uniref:flagellar biosynthetic protein FliO n=1 Tax=Thiomicrospira sp. TaxID=935 RepID=UPI0019DEB270|nr:flagellar biosynthetic protein FliO [Thiomicrospira sp.]MBE0493854.1 flagellar biosynthetic protein FliO [Thiomicrospira sp.]